MKYTQREGDACAVCGRHFSVRRYATGAVTVLCGCGCLVLTSRGAWSFVGKDDYKKDYAHLRAAKREALSMIEVKGGVKPVVSLSKARERSNLARKKKGAKEKEARG